MPSPFDVKTFSAVLSILASNKTDLDKTSLLQKLNQPHVSTVAKAVPWVKANSPVEVPAVIEYHVCPRSCLIFWKEYAEHKSCAQCGAQRFLVTGKPASIFPYLPIVTRIRRMYASSTWSQIIQDQYNRTVEDNCFSDVADGDLFKDVMSQVDYSKYSMPFYFGMDGITQDAQKEHSVDPLALVNLYLPPEMRTKSVHTMCAGLTPPNSNNIKIFLQVLLLLTTPTPILNLVRCSMFGITYCYLLLLIATYCYLLLHNIYSDVTRRNLRAVQCFRCPY